MTRRSTAADLSRWKRRGNTTQRDLGYRHQVRRKQLLPGAMNTPCPGPATGRRSKRCTGVMIDPSRMDLDHSVPRALGGRHGDRIICTPCNRGAGATLGNTMRAQANARARSSALPQW
jgi:hypothetical protein